MRKMREGILKDIENDARNRNIPIVSSHIGQYLFQFTRLAKAVSILECGTAIGYSTIWLALATEEWGGSVTTIEVDANLAYEAEQNFRRAKVEGMIDLIIGDAVEKVDMLEGPFDLCFIDIGEQQCHELFAEVMKRLNPRDIFLGDNIMFLEKDFGRHSGRFSDDKGGNIMA